MEELIRSRLRDSAELKQQAAVEMAPLLAEAAKESIRRLKEGGRIYFMGNGGSAADAQHLVGELVGRFYRNRAPLPAVCLDTNLCSMTAIGNDYGFEDCFLRPVQALVTDRDVVVAISTSGESANILAALEAARERGAYCIGLTGKGGGQFSRLCQANLVVPHRDTPRIQELHITLGHILCELIERELFPA